MSIVNFGDLAASFASQVLTEAARPLRLRLAAKRSVLSDVLMIQRIDIREALYEGITAHVTALSTRVDLPLKAFIGLPMEVQVVTDRGALRRFCLIVTDVRAGQSDGGLATFQLTGRDAMGVMERRVNTRVFRDTNVLEISHVMLSEWLQRIPSLGRAFAFDLSGVDAGLYPDREFTHQHNESDPAFLRRLWKRSGLSWFVAPGAAVDDEDTPLHTLRLFDDAMTLPENAAGDIRYHRDSATELRDAVTLFAPARQLVSGSALRSSWDYQRSGLMQAHEPSIQDQGETGNELAAMLRDAVIEMPHAGDSSDDHTRLTGLRMQRHEFDAKCVHGTSGVRDLAVGEWNTFSGHELLNGRPVEERRYLVTEVHHLAENNLPKNLNERAQALLAASATTPGWTSAATSTSADRRYLNRFVAVRRDTVIVPAWNPRADLPPVHPLTALVVGPEGEEVHCDELGRVKVQFQGLDPEDHDHANGAGTSSTDRDSAWLRVDQGWAGWSFGNSQLPRVGMEVQVDFLGGDPDRPMITGVVYNARNRPAAFTHVGSLPGNKYLSGIKTKEVFGSRYNQLRFDDTPSQISAQLASEDGHSQLNLGHLTTPRDNGRASPRGEGAELRSDESVAIRSAKALLISAYKRLGVREGQLARSELMALLKDCRELTGTLGRYAAKHQGIEPDFLPQFDVERALEHWEGGSNTDPDGPPGGAPIVGIAAPDGIAIATNKALVSYAGSNVDTVAQEHLQFTSGEKFNLNAGRGVSVFAHHGGIKAIAHQGKLLMQAQHGDIEANAAKNIKWTATEGSIVGMAREITLISEDGSFIRIGNGITMGTNGAIAQKAASFPHSGPATLATELPTFEKDAPDQRFKLRYGGIGGGNFGDGAFAVLRRHEIHLSDGSIVAGKTDDEGRTDLLVRQQMHIAKIEVFSN